MTDMPELIKFKATCNSCGTEIEKRVKVPKGRLEEVGDGKRQFPAFCTAEQEDQLFTAEEKV
jgi:PHP family Zn ribbon phosphoesterase